ncbi:hypothetical protein K435DRAFT_60581 [Dendrothele bispora CBS 962.96]|uniref:Uncharacterized protein n=1 Tax=Dendrothele bispora (strain CBS 962.96) TaxID=1314807 RepID=A0A4S8KRA9_DENBC|nr:hypothetical protein K435DRAFT_60581 [Dendrothele bispora CBS 962.96]
MLVSLTRDQGKRKSWLLLSYLPFIRPHIGTSQIAVNLVSWRKKRRFEYRSLEWRDRFFRGFLFGYVLGSTGFECTPA